MSKKSKKKNEDFLAQEARESAQQGEAYTLDIPDDEVWTYQIEGLQAPHINQPFKNAKRNKIIVVLVLIVAIGASMFFSVWAVHNDTYKYKELEDGTYELVKFSNPGSVTDITIDYVVDNKSGIKDETKPISKIDDYAFNCDEQLSTITIGKDVKEIESKAIYSCWNLRSVWIDDSNDSYCDIDGVVYTKDLTHAVHYPTAHDMQLMINNDYAEEKIEGECRKFISKVTDENGDLVDEQGNNLVSRVWGTNKLYNEYWMQTYNKLCRTYVVPSTVTSLDDMSFAYADVVDLYIPEGVTYLGNMAIFKNTAMVNIYTYKTDTVITDTTYKAIDSMTEIYDSLPEGLEFMGSDCLYYTRGLSYIYIPSTVTHIGHHALWDSVYKEDKQLKGVTEVNTSYESEEAFKEKCETGDQWRPQYDYMLFKKSISVNYAAQRTSQKAKNINNQYYWAVQWINNNKSDEVKEKSSYLIKDLDNDGTPECVLREYNEKTKKTEDTIYTFNYDYLDEYKGVASYADDEFSKLDDNTQLDGILETVK